MWIRRITRTLVTAPASNLVHFRLAYPYTLKKGERLGTHRTSDPHEQRYAREGANLSQ